MKKILWLLCLAAVSAGAVSVVDDDGRRITLPKPARRIVSTAPHITELLYGAGGSGHVAAVTSYSDYPAEAKSLPLVGSNRQIDMERVLALKPDLIVAWRGGNPVRQIEQLERLGIPVFYSNPVKMEDIPETLIRFGLLIGKPGKGREEAAAWRNRLKILAAQYEKRAVLKVFYQISEKPLYTLNGKHIVSESIRICGGQNVFSGLPVTVPHVSVESVLEKNPDVIFISRSGGSLEGANFWKRYGMVSAVRRNSLYEMESDLMDRPGPRLIEGLSVLCEKMEEARRNLRAW